MQSIGDYDDVKSTLTSSTAQRSQLGATWKGSLDQTMNTGFGSSTRRTMNGRGVREGREEELFGVSSIYGVGRTGKQPAAVPVGLSRAAVGKLPAATDDNENREESDSDMSITVKLGRNRVDEIAAERQQLRWIFVEKGATPVQASQPETKKSVKTANKGGTKISGKAIKRSKMKEKKKKGSWMARWRPKLTWFV